MKALKSIISQGCVIFSIITLIIYSAGAIISNADRSFIPDIKFIWLFFAFSLLLAATNKILYIKKIKLIPRLLIHFAVCLALYFVSVVLCGGFAKSGAQTLIALSFFVIIYIIFAIAAAIIIGRSERKKADKEEYVSQFK